MIRKGMTTQRYYWQLTILHIVFVLGQLTFGIVVYNVVSWGIEGSMGRAMSLIVAPIVLLGVFFLVQIIGRMQLNIITRVPTLPQKMRGYFIFQLLRWVILSAGVTTVLAITFFSANIMLILYAAAGLVGLIYFSPSRRRTIQELSLSVGEIEWLTKDDNIIMK